MNIPVKRLNISLKADIRRVVLRPFNPTTELRSRKIVDRILSLTLTEIEREYEKIVAEFEHRHRQLESFYIQRFNDNKKFLKNTRNLKEIQKKLIGAYFTLEYSLEAASLFNPSLVWHPDQTGLPEGSRRFIISLRATGEGHISSIEFRSGMIHPDHSIQMDETSEWITTPSYSKNDTGYKASFSEECPISERVFFPFLKEESNGMEDLRMVCFMNDRNERIYYGTYTAYDGHQIYSMLLETSDFVRYTIRKLTGSQIQNKNLALFPRKINGQYVMLSRQDNENNYIMFSDRIDSWEKKSLIMEPRYSWEFFQIGNCGSPIETPEGWLVLSHGVGAMRKYVISAFLLDLNDPGRVIGKLREPLLMANESEREGYVPNVVYTCGGNLYNDSLLFPYAMSDYACGFVLVDLNSLFSELS